MPVVSPLGGPDRKFGTTVPDLVGINKSCEVVIDIAKSIKAAVYHGQPYEDFLSSVLAGLTPAYFHISGCRIDNPVDEHANLWEATFSVAWVRGWLEEYARKKDICLVFETPPGDDGLANYIKNIEYFRVAGL